MKNFIYLLACIASTFLLSCDGDFPIDFPGSTGPTGATGPTGSLDRYADWMTNILNEHSDEVISLKDICMPGAHDAGMYVLSTCTFGANACNTQTQDLDMTEMLMKGARTFDIRPVLAGGEYFTQHKTGCEDALGCRGDRIANILQQTRDFVEEHSELVILKFGHFCDVEPLDAGLQQIVASTLGNRLYKETTLITEPFVNRDLANIIPDNEGKGKVMIVYTGVSNSATNRSNGVFSSAYLPSSGSYANSFVFEDMKADQLNKYSNFNHSSNRTFDVSWTMTLDAQLSIDCTVNIFGAPGIEYYASIAHTNLTSTVSEMIADGSIGPNKIPNVWWVDFMDDYIMEECIRINEVGLE